LTVVGLGLIGPALLGLTLGVTMPLGPVSSLQSFVALVAAALVGALAGRLLSSRWAALAAPAVLAVGYEAVRWGAGGPTLGPIRFDLGIWGAMAFVVGRGFDALVILLPMAIGALWGAALARRSTPKPTRTRRTGRVLRGLGLGLATLAVLAFAAALARPASTEPILDADGAPVPGSVAELATIPIGGHDQVVMLRGRDVDAPVMLFLEGGPGGTAIGAMRQAGQDLEQDFVVATWDQRGTGKSIAAREPVETLTLDQMVADTIEVADYLRDRFDEQRIYLVGSSWGTTLGVLTAQARPDLFHAYVGLGQMVDQQETDKLMYAQSLDYAQRVGDQALATTLQRLGPPPYQDMLAYPIALSSNPQWLDYPRGADYEPGAEYPASLFVPEYTLTEQVRAMGAIIDTFAVLYPQLQEVDFRVDVPELAVPVFVVEGAYEAPGRSALALDWFQALDAPVTRLVTWENSGHTPHLDEPGRFHEFMREVSAATYPGAAT
jgi:pimeloyl-ACP methyl ester carboxylesterase